METEEKITEYKFDNGRITVRFHGEPDYDKIKAGAEQFIKSVLQSHHLSALPEEWLKTSDDKYYK